MAKLSFPRGTTYQIGVTVQEDGSPMDLSSSSIRFTVKTDEYDDDIDDNSAIIVKNMSGGSDGLVNISILPDDTKTIKPGKYFYDIKVEKDNNNETIYLVDQGTLDITGSPTNRLD